MIVDIGTFETSIESGRVESSAKSTFIRLVGGGGCDDKDDICC